MNKSAKHNRLFLLAFAVGIAALLLSIFKVHATLISKVSSLHEPVKIVEAAPSGPRKATVALTSNPRQVLDPSPASSESDPAAALTCGLWDASLSPEDKSPYQGPYDCTGQSPQTITESFHNIFTYSGGRVSWWIGYDYGTIVNQGGDQCPNPPLVITASRPMSYWRQDFVGCYDQTVTFTANTGQVIQSPCSFNQASAEFIGTNITQVTISGSPNNRVFLNGNTSYIEDTACACPNIPVVP